MHNKTVVIQGVQIACKLLDIPEPQVLFAKSTTNKTKHITGIFTPKEYRIFFNEDWVLNSSEAEVLLFCFHESRHAYQYYSVKNNINETSETLEIWRKQLLDDYKSPHGELNDYHEYLQQSIESDAIRWSTNKLGELFGVKAEEINI